MSGGTIKPEDRPGWRPKPGAENTDRAQIAALGDEAIVDGLMRRAGVGGIPVQWVEIGEDGNRWTVWKGGDCPIGDLAMMFWAKYRDGSESRGNYAAHYRWTHTGEDDDIVAYREEGPIDPAGFTPDLGDGWGPGERDTRRRIEAEFAKMETTKLPTHTDAGGWRGHLPLCRGPGGIQARRLRAMVRGVRR